VVRTQDQLTVCTDKWFSLGLRDRGTTDPTRFACRTNSDVDRTDPCMNSNSTSYIGAAFSEAKLPAGKSGRTKSHRRQTRGAHQQRTLIVQRVRGDSLNPTKGEIGICVHYYGSNKHIYLYNNLFDNNKTPIVRSNSFVNKMISLIIGSQSGIKSKHIRVRTWLHMA
jgi:hypothetical protein